MKYDQLWLIFWGLTIATLFRYGGAFALVLAGV